MSQKTYLTILRGGIYLSFLSVFLVFSKLYFPYITSKQIYFNVLIEVLLIFWISFIIKYPDFKPKKSYISFGLIAFFTAIFISSVFGADFNLSFWGDAERMLGVFHLLHFLAFYFILITVLREWKDWRIVFILSIVVATLVSLHGQVKNIHYSTIGNTAYVSGYMIFNIFFALILFLKEIKLDRSKALLTASFSFTTIFLMGLAFRLTHTRGAYIGIAASFLVMLFLFILFSKSKKIKLTCLSLALVFILLVGLVFKNSDSSFVKNNSILTTIAQINFNAVTFQTRLISWKAAYKDLPNHLLLGTGYGNFAITFDKYFEPTFYDYTRSETYFDRAHNNIVDIASTTGVIGIGAYFSIFIAVLYYLILGLRKKKISSTEFIVIIGLLTAYFIQNLVVFDSLVTYIPLMLLFAYVYYLNKGDELAEKHKDASLTNKEIYSLAGVGIIILVILFNYNIKPYNSFRGAIKGAVAYAQNDFIKGYEENKKVLDKESVLDRDVRNTFSRSVIEHSAQLSKIPKEKALEILEYNILMGEKNIAYNPKDSLMQMEMARTYDMTSRFYKDNPEKFSFYSDRALEAIDKSIEASPGRINIYYEKAQIYVIRGEKDKAIETLEYAYSLNRNYFDSPCNLSKYYFYFKEEENGFKYMDECIDLGGTSMLAPKEYVMGLANHYIDKEDYAKVMSLYERIVQLDGEDAKAWAGLAKLRADAKENEKAIEAAEKAAEVDKSYREAVDLFIGELRGK